MVEWSFQIGSCALKLFPFHYFSGRIYDTMRSRPADFMIWTGDHVYFMKPWQWNSKEGMVKAYREKREYPKLKKFMESRKQYAIWDDHDFGPNNAGSEFANKDKALEVFREMWPHQPFANEEGVYFKFKHEEAEFFMCDGRYFKVPGQQLFGKEQLDWLCNELKNSNATFKFVCVGVQMLCEGGFENFRKYPDEFDYFMNFIEKNKIEGLVFLSGDVHYSEISKVDREVGYTLYDFTFSPLTSLPINYFKKNKNRVKDTKINRYNFGELSFTGADGNRTCTIKCISKKGREYWSFQINENDLKYKNP